MSHNCFVNLEEHTEDTLYTFGNIESELVYYCSVCDKKFSYIEVSKYFNGEV